MTTQIHFFLKYLPMKFLLTSVDDAILPDYLGSTLRGAIGRALYHDVDAYNYLYNNRTLSAERKDIVNPYVIIPPEMGTATYKAGDPLSFDMILLGDSAQYVRPLVHALTNKQEIYLGASKYLFSLEKVVHRLDQRVIWQEDTFYDIATRGATLLGSGLSRVKQLTLYIRTPLRIRRDGALLEKIDFPTLIRNTINRIDAIVTRYGGWIDKEEARHIQKLSTEVLTTQNDMEMKTLQRYSSKHGINVDFSGLMGMIRFEGDLSPFVPWIYAAQVLHIGRNTTFGMGRIDAEFL